MKTAKVAQEYLIVIAIFCLYGFSLKAQDLEIQLAENDARAESYMHEGNLSQAAYVYTTSADLLYRAELLEEAAEYFEKALKLNDQMGNSHRVLILHTQLGILYMDAGKYSEAIPHLEEEKLQAEQKELEKQSKRYMELQVEKEKLEAELEEGRLQMEKIDKDDPNHELEQQRIRELQLEKEKLEAELDAALEQEKEKLERKK